MGATRRLGMGPVLLVAATALTGCGLLPAADPEPAFEGTPEVALLYVSGAPAVAEDGFELRLVNAEGRVVRTIPVLPGERLIAQLGVDQGRYTLAESHGACSLDVELVGGREADVLATLGAGGSCILGPAGDHEPEMNGHPLFGSVSVTVLADALPDGVRLRVRSLDEPPNPVPEPVDDEPDRPGQFTVFDLPQGAYEAQAIDGAAILGAAAFVVGAGDASAPSLTMDLASPQATGG